MDFGFTVFTSQMRTQKHIFFRLMNIAKSPSVNPLSPKALAEPVRRILTGRHVTKRQEIEFASLRVVAAAPAIVYFLSAPGASLQANK